MKCTIFGKRFSVQKKYVYNVVVNKNEGLIIPCNVIFDAMDCPKCGCQHLLKVREPREEEKALEGDA